MTSYGKIFLTVFAFAVMFLGLVAATMALFGPPLGILILQLVGFLYCWMLFAYLNYRNGRQSELVHLLTTAAESGVPLAPALRAYVRDRPRGTAREIWVATLLFFVLPGYYWVWYRRSSFDRKVAHAAARLEAGESLHAALAAAPGLVPRETLLAVAVGESTGQLARCLRGSNPDRLAPFWLELLPRVLYPVVLLFVMTGVTSFWMIYILPRIERILRDFDEPMPELTARVVAVGRGMSNEVYAVIVPGAFACLLAFFCSSTVRWYFPGVARLYRMQVQSRVLRLLAVLIDVGKPVPQALAVLSGSGAFASYPRQRLEEARREAEEGESLADSLQEADLLRPSMVPLVRAAERAHNLPWALTELGDHLFNRMVRLVRRISMAVFPVCVLAVGGLVAAIAIGMFLPLIQLLTRLST